MQVAILAGGLATRLRPRTLTVPKFLLPVADRPFGAWLLARLAQAGYDDVVLCVGHLAATIRDAIGDGSAFGLRVRYVEDGARKSASGEAPTLLGTAGALRHAIDDLAPTFLVTYGDSYLPFDYAAPLRELDACSDADGVMSVYRNEGKWDTSNTAIRLDATGDAWVSRYEKAKSGTGLEGVSPSATGLDYIDYGAMALRREIIAALPDGVAAGLDQIQHDLAKRGRLRAYLARARFFEIGSEAGLLELDRALTAGKGRIAT